MNIRPLLVVPTYDNPGSIGPVVRELLAGTALPILVVDDGSRAPVAPRLADAAAGRLTVVRHERNRGKGAAVKTAFRWAQERAYTHVLTFDGDGQHVVAEVEGLLAAAAARPWSLVIGRRAFPAANVPGVSRFGRAFSNFWVRYTTGVGVNDSQSGLRVYPLFHVQGLACRTDRYDFEVEILTKLLWAGVDVAELPVAVVYPPPAERVSHFHKLRDNARISLLNTYLVVLSLFRRNLAPPKLALAGAAGALLGFSPWPPEARFLALAAATVGLRLNAWVALAWFVAGWGAPATPGARAGALAAAGAFAAAAALAARRRAARAPAKPWTGHSRGGRLGNLFLARVSRWLGLGATYACLAVIAPYFYLCAPRAKRSSLEYFRALLPAEPWVRRHLHVVRHFYTFGTVLLDRLFQSFHAEPVFAVRVEGAASVDRASAGGRGVIVLTAHAGGWDLATRSLVANHLGRQGVVAEFVAAGVTSDSTVRAAERGLVRRASLHNEAAPILAYRELLDRGQVVGMMGDRPMTAGKLALLPFLGRLAAFDLAPFRLGAALGVDVVYCFAFKTGYKSYTLTLEPPPPPPPGASRDDACEHGARHFAAALERHLRRHPHQWFNFYPFFSTRPAAPGVGEPVVALGGAVAER